MKASDLPPIRIWKDDFGKIWTLDHRRLAAFKLAGLDEVPFKWASPSEVSKQMWKMSTKTDGKSIILKLSNEIKKMLG
ncbi:ParB/Srx family N-terminal domain-containing protein [Cronobacter dublinensis]